MKHMNMIKHLAIAAAMAMGLALGAQATAVDYTICLTNGEAHKNSASGDNITSEVAGMGLAYDQGVWTMNNFNLVSTMGKALKFLDDNVVITVGGSNSITNGAGNFSEPTPLLGNRNLVINGAETGINTLSLSCLYTSGVGWGSGLRADNRGSLTIGDNVTVTTFCVTNKDRCAVGTYAGSITVLGSGKLIAEVSDGGDPERAKATSSNNQPDADAKNTGTETTPTWDDVWGTYVNDNVIATRITLTKRVVLDPIAFQVTAPTGAQAAVYTNAVEAANLVPAGGTIWSNGVAYVVYTVTEPGKVFENGAKAVTNTLDTANEPATDKSAYVPKSVVSPTVQLGVVAQRYPWNGTLDVGYRATYAKDVPAVVTVEANGVKYTQEVKISSGTNTVAFTNLPKELKAKDAKVTLKLQ